MGAAAGQHYPKSWDEFRTWFATDDDCADYLDWLRFGNGFSCPACGAEGHGWRRRSGLWDCGACSAVVSVTAGTIFDKTRLPLTVWFAAAWKMTQQSTGISKLGLQRELGLSSSQTAWHLLHRYRAAMARFERPRLSGDVEVDETYIGGARPGKRGRGAYGKTLVVIAVEMPATRGLGRCRMQVVKEASREELHGFIRRNIEEGSVVVTDGLPAYKTIDATGDYTHKAHDIKNSGHQAHELLPGVHRVAANLKTWITGTFHGSVSPEHLQVYLEEFTFRFNRRRSRSRGMLFYRLLECSLAAAPLQYSTLVRVQRPKKSAPTPPKNPTLTHQAFEPRHRPWRAASSRTAP